MDRERIPALVAPTGTARAFLPYVLLAAGLFLSAAFLGAAAGVGGLSGPTFPVRREAPALDAYSFWDLFGHNALVGTVLVLGLLLAAVPTVYLLLLNGFTTGSILVEAAGNVGVLATVGGVLPHAVFELPALWIGAGICFRIVHVFWKVITEERREYGLHVVAAQSALAFVVMIVLLGVAAAVEAVVTPVVLQVLL